MSGAPVTDHDLTVVMGAHQAAATIDAALASLAGQGVRPGRVVVVDDGSTDDTAERARRWERLLPVEVLRHEANRGAAAAIRTALATVDTTRYAVFDADDVAFPDHLESLVAVHRERGGVVTPDALLWWPGRDRALARWTALHPRPAEGQELLGLVAVNWLLGTGVYDRSVVESVGGVRDLPACQDWDLHLRLLDAGVPIARLGHPTMLYRQHGATVSKGAAAERAGARVLEDLAATTSSAEVGEAAARRARARRARAALQDAYRQARRGARGPARRAAAGALRGGGRAATARAAAVVAAPGASTRLHDRIAAPAPAPVPAPAGGRPTIGVVVPAYEAAATLDAALASIATQTRRPDHVVVVDDGSGDGTADIARRWAPFLPLEVVVHGRNQGLGETRRTAIGHLRTDLVALLDADDVWLPDHLQLLEGRWAPGRLVSGNAASWWPGAALDPASYHEHRPIPAAPRQLASLLVENFVFVGSLFERSAYDAVGGFATWPHGCEDWHLWLRLVDGGAEVVAPPRTSTLYRLRADSMSASDKLLETEVEVVRTFAPQREDRRLTAARRTALRRRRARAGLRAAYQLADDHPWQARRAAVRALQGRPHNVVRGAALLLAPRSVVARRELVHRRVLLPDA